MNKYHVWVVGYFTTDVNADTPEQARKLATDEIFRELDRSEFNTFVYCAPDYEMDPEKID